MKWEVAAKKKSVNINILTAFQLLPYQNQMVTNTAVWSNKDNWKGKKKKIKKKNLNFLIVVECMAPCRFVVLPWTEQRLSAWVLNWNSPGEKSAPACSASPWGCAVVQKAGEAERDGKPLHCEMVGGDAFCSYSTWDAQWHKVIFASAVASRQTLIFSDFSSFIVHSWLSNCCVQVSWPH